MQQPYCCCCTFSTSFPRSVKYFLQSKPNSSSVCLREASSALTQRKKVLCDICNCLAASLAVIAPFCHAIQYCSYSLGRSIGLGPNRTLILWGDTNIGNYAFQGCSSLEEVSISSGTEYIGDYAFEGCFSLENVIMWGRSTKIGKNAFANCPKLKNAPR